MPTGEICPRDVQPRRDFAAPSASPLHCTALRIYRYVLLQVIGLLHVAFDILAFRSDVGFWKGRESLGGVSSRAEALLCARADALRAAPGVEMRGVASPLPCAGKPW